MNRPRRPSRRPGAGPSGSGGPPNPASESPTSVCPIVATCTTQRVRFRRPRPRRLHGPERDRSVPILPAKTAHRYSVRRVPDARRNRSEPDNVESRPGPAPDPISLMGTGSSDDLDQGRQHHEQRHPGADPHQPLRRRRQLADLGGGAAPVAVPGVSESEANPASPATRHRSLQELLRQSVTFGVTPPSGKNRGNGGQLVERTSRHPTPTRPPVVRRQLRAPRDHSTPRTTL